MAEEKRKIGQKVVDFAAGIITGYDNLMARKDKLVLKVHYVLAKTIHSQRSHVLKIKKFILGYFAGIILVAVALVALFNYATAYEYSYNGKVLGLVKNQEDVVKILDIASDELSKEYNSNIEIDADTDITFKRVVSVNKDIDDADQVLKRLTYMSDMQAEAYGIYVDENLFVIVQSKDAANQVLDKIQNSYMTKNRHTTYEKVGFKEKVEIKKINTQLARINSINSAVKKLITGGSGEVVYTVKSGDTYYDICKKYNTSFSELKKTNPKLKENELYSGQKIVVSKAVSVLTVETTEKSTFTQKTKYKTVYKKDSNMYKGDSDVIQKGKYGKRIVTARIVRVNGDKKTTKILKSRVLQKPVKKIVVKGTKVRPKTAPTGKFMYPVSGFTLTSTFGYRWGRMHEGLDLAAPTGTTIRAADGGTVVRAGYFGAYGICIDINHGNGITSRYGHCSAASVRPGQKVYKGQVIGAVGNTGRSTGSHCHFEIRVNGSSVNPMNYL